MSSPARNPLDDEGPDAVRTDQERPALRSVGQGVDLVGGELGGASRDLGSHTPTWEGQSSERRPSSGSRSDPSWCLPWCPPGSQARDEATHQPPTAHLRSGEQLAAVCGRAASRWQRLDRRSREARNVDLCATCADQVSDPPAQSANRPAPGIPAVQEAHWQSYLTALSQSAEVSPATRRTYASRVSHYLRWLGPNDSTSENLHAYRSALQVERKSARTINAHVTAIAHFHRHLGREVERPGQLNDPGSVPEFLSPSEVERLSTTISVWSSARDQSILRLLLSLGFRTGELSGLDHAHLRPDPNGVRLSAPAGRNHGSRQFALPVADFPYLARVAAESEQPERPLFANQRGERLTARAIAMLVDRAGMASGLVGLNPRTLRQTAITDRLTAGRGSQLTLIANVGDDRRTVLIKEIGLALTSRAAAATEALRTAAEAAPHPEPAAAARHRAIQQCAATLLAGLVAPLPPQSAVAGLEPDASSGSSTDHDCVAARADLDVMLVGLLADVLPRESTAAYLSRLTRFVHQHAPELDIVYRRLYRRRGTALLTHEPIALIVFERTEAAPQLLTDVWRRHLPAAELDDLTAIWRRVRRLRHRSRLAG